MKETYTAIQIELAETQLPNIPGRVCCATQCVDFARWVLTLEPEPSDQPILPAQELAFCKRHFILLLRSTLKLHSLNPTPEP